MTATVSSRFASDARLDVIRYSQVWEDHVLLERGLAVGPGDDVLSIGSAGDNVLALLLTGPRSLVAVDVSPAQTALLELKLAALRRLTHTEFACLLGARESTDRDALYARVRDALDSHARAFWDAHRAELRGGVLRAGMLERYFERFRARHVARLVPAGQLEQLLDLDDREQQAELFDRLLGTTAFEAAVREAFTPEAMAGRARDATQFRYAEPDDAPGFFLRRLRHVCTVLPTRGNFYLEWFFTGRYGDLATGPPFLRPDNFDRLKELAGRVAVVTEELSDFLASQPSGAFSAANLSDVFEYLPEDAAGELLGLVGSRLRPGARVAYWNLLVARSLPAGGAYALRPRRAWSRGLWEHDRVFFYSDFHIDEKEPCPPSR
ncbi:MAG TPA: DUF3419 family protein [Solirubrobacteraceae bacterium]|nr:DUF3419 family protein [Solirubrobacteraceae bacterium]